ncbi:MAG: hypothetical protein V3T15_03670 [Pseudomonadales bacterium]|nr:hypothetical protein [Gammaproteobacteria bacterium]
MSGKTVIILTADYRIRGDIDVAPDERVTDYITAAKTFLAVTNAEVRTLEGRIMFASSFINVHRDHIVVVAPEELTSRN